MLVQHINHFLSQVNIKYVSTLVKSTKWLYYNHLLLNVTKASFEYISKNLVMAQLSEYSKNTIRYTLKRNEKKMNLEIITRDG